MTDKMNRILTLLLLLGAFGCATKGHLDPAWTERDAWMKEPPFWLPYPYEWEKVPCSAVVASRSKEAVALLRDVPAIALTTEQVSLFRPDLSPVRDDLTPYLVRAVFLNEGNGTFGASTHKGLLLIAHGCLGNEPVPMRRGAVIVRLPESPRKVYVTCGMVE